MRTGITLGILNNAFYLGLTFSALRFIHPELVIVVVSTAPFLTTILAARVSLEPINVYKVAGIATGFTGVLIITGIGFSPVPDMSGIALALIGTVAFSIATVYFQGSAAGIPVLPLTFWQSFAGAVVLLPVALLFRPKPGIRQQDLVGIGVVTVGLLITINARNRGKNRARAKRRRTLARKPSPAS
jgi:drug/metabolite transporter (DMT)-like permease